MMFRFASPWFLLLLIPVWAVFASKVMGKGRVWFRQHGPDPHKAPLGVRPCRPVLQVAALTGLGRPPSSPWLWLSRLIPLLKAVAITCLVLALARPQAGQHKTRVSTQGVNIILALDLSESMQALDFKQDGKIVTRLAAVQGVVSDFILKREGDRIGLVVFGSNAFTQLPLTRDYNTIAFMLDHLKIGAAGPRTAIGDAIGISLKRLEDVESKSNIIILLTDGKSNAGQLNWQDAVKIAAARSVKIHTIGVGSRGKAPFLVDGLFGKQYVYQQVDMDWQALDTIARETNGQFFKASDTQGLEKIYKIIDALEKTRVDVDKWVAYQELFRYFLVPGLVLYLVCLSLTQTRVVRIP